MINPKISYLVIAIFTCVVYSPAHAQIVNTTVKSFQIPRVSAAPQIDGHLSSGEWDNAIVVEDFHESDPVEFSEPERRTVFSFMYTEDSLYISAEEYRLLSNYRSLPTNLQKTVDSLLKGITTEFKSEK